MIRKLRMKLIVVAMLSLLLVLLVIFSIVCMVNYWKMAVEADSILTVLSENDGSFPKQKLTDGEAFFLDELQEEGYRFSLELPYESRYFSVFFTVDGTIISVNTDSIAAVDREMAIRYAQEVMETGESRGFADDYRFMVYPVGEEMHMIFLDYGREMGAFRTFLFSTAGVGILGLLAVLCLLIFLSGKIVKPFSESYDKQKQFITDAGHELKTPLAIINADVEVLEMDMGANEWLLDIQNQTSRLADLTNSLIFLSRMEEQPRTEMIEFPLSGVVEEIAESFQAVAKTHHKTITCRIQPQLSFCGDEKALRQLITILLDNAVKYSNDGGMIELSLEKQKNMVRLSVFNTAEYVSRESLPHLFDRFYRADQSRNSKTGGYGLGLSIAAAIVNTHRGRLTAVTQDEKSLLITASFPV